jgi:alpha-tubulin suppressor-like RCC1 family protein
VITGEYETFWRSTADGELYGAANGAWRLGAGDYAGPAFPPPQVVFPASRTIAAGAGGLHFAIATDNTGQVWEWGDIGSNPNLVNSNVPTQVPLNLSDGSGHNVVSMAAAVAFSTAVDYKGVVWVWDDTTGGIQGDGTAGSATTLTPVSVSIPNKKIAKVVASDIILALATDGSVWSWGGNGTQDDLGRSGSGLTPGQVTGLPADIVDVATGQSFSYALASNGDLYMWGLYGEIAGFCAGWCPQSTPVLLNSTIHLPTDVTGTSISASSEASYLIMSDGSLWAWGSDGEGLVGDGKETDFATANPPYAWDFNKDDLLVATAVRIFPASSKVSKVFTGSAAVYYVFVLTSDGELYSWGRNKTGALGNGVFPLSLIEASSYPNSWDVTTPTLVSPLTAPNKPTVSPECVTNPAASNCWCNGDPSGPQDC